MSDERMAEVSEGYDLQLPDSGDRSYYKRSKVEMIDAFEAILDNQELSAVEGYLLGNLLKYLSRYRSKENPVEDLTKAAWYLNRLRERVKERAAGLA